MAASAVSQSTPSGNFYQQTQHYQQQPTQYSEGTYTIGGGSSSAVQQQYGGLTSGGATTSGQTGGYTTTTTTSTTQQQYVSGAPQQGGEYMSIIGGGHQVGRVSEGHQTQQSYTTTSGIGGVAQHQYQGSVVGSTAGRGTTYTSTGGEYEKSRQTMSSNVVSEQLLGDLPKQDGVRYVEIPVVQEVIKHVKKQEHIYNTKHVAKPVVEYEYVDKVVPVVQWVDRPVEKIQHEDVWVDKFVNVYQDREVVAERRVPKQVVKIVEKTVEVPGERIEVEKPYDVENRVPVVHHRDQNVPVLVAQTVRPYVVESNDFVECDVTEYVPEVIPVDIQVPKPIAASLIAVGVRDQYHRVVNVPAAQYNTILRSVNPQITEQRELPFQYEGNQVPFLTGSEFTNVVAPLPNATIEGYKGTAIVHQGMPSQAYTTNTGGVVAMARAAGAYETFEGSQTHRHHHQSYGGGYGHPIATARSTTTVTTSTSTSKGGRHRRSHSHGQYHKQTATQQQQQSGAKDRTSTSVAGKAQKKKACC